VSIHRLKRNSTAGELSVVLSTRVELERYKNGCEVLHNMVVTTQGPAHRRTGTKFVFDMTSLFGDIDDTFSFKDNVRSIPFIFSETQSYELTFYRDVDDECHVIFGYKEGILADPLDSTKPYVVDLGDDFDLLGFDYAQSGDQLFFAMSTHPQSTLSRHDHTDWRYEDVTFTHKPAEWNEENGLPTKVSFFEQRLVYGASINKPQTIWGSKSSSFLDFGVSDTIVESDAITFTLASGEQNKFQWMLSSRRLLIGTLGDEWSVGGYGAPLSYKSVVSTRQTNQGSEAQKPIMIGSATLFIERLGRAVNEFIYDYNSDSYGVIDTTLLAPHLFQNYSILHWAYQQAPFGIIWSTRDDGRLLGFTYQRKHKVMGWHEHSTDGKFITVVSIPSKEHREDSVWFSVLRYINGSFRLYKEKLTPEFKGTNVFDAWFVDAGASVEKTAEIKLAQVVGSTLELLVTKDQVFAFKQWVQIRGVVVDNPEINTILSRPVMVTAYEDSTIPDLKKLTVSLEGATYEGDAPLLLKDAKVYAGFTDVAGLDFLEGKTVSILLNGAVSPPQQVVNGEIDLPVIAYKLTVGLPFKSTYIPLEADLELATGTTLGRNQRVTQIAVKVQQSVGMKIGRTLDALEEVPFRAPTHLTGQAVPLFTGWVYKSFPEGYENKTQIVIQQDQPLPLTVIGTVDEIEVYDRYRS